MSSSQLAIVFVGAVVPEAWCECSPACSVAGNRFQLNLIRVLEQTIGCVPEIISVKPVASYPKGREIFVRSTSVVIGEGTRCRLVPFVNVLLLKQVTIGLAILFRLMVGLWRVRSQPRYVVVHNVCASKSLPVLLATKLLGGKSVAVVADLPHNLRYDFRGLYGLLNRLNLFIETQSLSHFTGVISLTRQIAQDYAPHVPSLVIEGAVELDKASPGNGSLGGVHSAQQGERICLYSGTLIELNGMKLLLHAFRQIPDSKYRLWITGRGPMETLIQEAAKHDPRIVYWGHVSLDQNRHYLRQAAVLINPRPSSYSPITRYTFPSKLLEYMISGRPVITTALPGIPEEYYPFVYLLRDETPDGLARLIQEVCTKDQAELTEFGQRAQTFVLQNKNWTRQGQRIYEFISTL